MIQKLLRQNISIPQLLGYAFAALAGMAIIFSAFCFSMDIQPLFAPGKKLFKKEFMVVNKKVPLLSAVQDKKTSFTQTEINELKQQSFVRSVSAFTPSRYQVKLYTDPSSPLPYFSSELFFESVPDHLLDNAFPEWKWGNETDIIPIIIPRYYLNLYNFGFAESQGLPQISEAVVPQVIFKVLISGNGQRGNLQGRIIGFSDDLNTILVPKTFMTWANTRFGDSSKPENISRLVMEVNNPANQEIAEFFASKENYDINSNKGDQGKLSYFLTLLIVIVMAIGILVILPAIGLMLLSINLLVYKNQKTLGNLVLLGYNRKKLANFYCRLVFIMNIIVGVFSVVITYYAQKWYSIKLTTLGITDFSIGLELTFGFAFLFVIIVSVVDMVWIHQKIKKMKIPARG